MSNKPIEHGTENGYKRCLRKYGASCAACRAAWSEARSERRRAYAASSPELNPHLNHGSPWTNVNHGCTCEACRTAFNAYQNERRQAKRAEASVAPSKSVDQTQSVMTCDLGFTHIVAS